MSTRYLQSAGCRALKYTGVCTSLVVKNSEDHSVACIKFLMECLSLPSLPGKWKIHVVVCCWFMQDWFLHEENRADV